MTTNPTEEEMRKALFGINADAISSQPVQPAITEIEGDSAPSSNLRKGSRASKAFTPRMRVTLRVGNDFEGETFERVHEADTLSSLLAEQEATKAARKKFRYVEVVSVERM